jgi:NAD(P)-dependent dehydrogenase (short-subunit alcohol dehydrogenase family)
VVQILFVHSVQFSIAADNAVLEGRDSREAVKQMLNQNPKGGCIINISSVHQTIPKPLYVPYATSKAGIEMMTKTMALELAQDNIRVNMVAPGAIETDMNIKVLEGINQYFVASC